MFVWFYSCLVFIWVYFVGVGIVGVVWLFVFSCLVWWFVCGLVVLFHFVLFCLVVCFIWFGVCLFGGWVSFVVLCGVLCSSVVFCYGVLFGGVGVVLCWFCVGLLCLFGGVGCLGSWVGGLCFWCLLLCCVGRWGCLVWLRCV